MAKKRVYFIHPAINSVQDLVRYLRIEKESYIDNLEWDSTNPQILFVSEMIYNDNRCFSVFKKLRQDDSRIFVFQGGEAVFPDLNLFDFAITQASDHPFSSRIVRMPAHVFYARSLLQEKFENKLTQEEARQLIAKRKFCNFIYSNPYSHPMRDDLFHAISKYKKVDSLGAHLNNTGELPTRRETNWAELSIDLKSNYKFSIACENALCEGYTSEKMLASFQAHSIPIYWGNPLVGEEYNEKAFINCHSFSSFDDLLKMIKEIDENEEKWIQMVCEPWQTKTQVEKTKKEIDIYLSFMKNILGLEQLPKKEAPSGTFSNIYREFFFRRFRRKKHLVRHFSHSVLRRIKLLFRRRTNKKHL